MAAVDYAATITALEQELDAIDQRRGDIQKAIETLRPLAGAAPSRSTRVSRRGRPARQLPGARRAVKRTNERTNERKARATGASLTTPC